ncbi:MAG: hypothetical protein ACE5G8_14250, partial [Anaerolineae bacterium]
MACVSGMLVLVFLAGAFWAEEAFVPRLFSGQGRGGLVRSAGARVVAYRTPKASVLPTRGREEVISLPATAVPPTDFPPAPTLTGTPLPTATPPPPATATPLPPPTATPTPV